MSKNLKREELIEKKAFTVSETLTNPENNENRIWNIDKKFTANLEIQQDVETSDNKWKLEFFET